MTNQTDGGFEGGKIGRTKLERRLGSEYVDLYLLLGRRILKGNKVIDREVGRPGEWS